MSADIVGRQEGPTDDTNQQDMPYFWLVSADNVGHVTAPVPHGPLVAYNVGRQNNVKMTTNILGRQYRPTMTGHAVRP